MEFLAKARSLGYSLRNYISPRADVSADLFLGVNNIIMSQAYVGPCSRFGDDNLVRQNAYLGHDLKVGDHNVFGPGCNVGGHGSIGSSCYVCMGSTVIDSLSLADETLVGAGGVVIRNTEAFSKNVGNPTRVIGYHQEEGIRMDPNHG
jgi:UDP-3-O-[3-hydroxymyristoyl] glucosamine N-acyltransferase